VWVSDDDLVRAALLACMDRDEVDSVDEVCGAEEAVAALVACFGDLDACLRFVQLGDA
jgi:hypothetical protein